MTYWMPVFSSAGSVWVDSSAVVSESTASAEFMCKTCEGFQDGQCDSNGNQWGPCVNRAEECSCVVLIPRVSKSAGFSFHGQWFHSDNGNGLLISLVRFPMNGSSSLMLRSQWRTISLSDHSLTFKLGYLGLRAQDTKLVSLAPTNAARSSSCGTRLCHDYRRLMIIWNISDGSVCLGAAILKIHVDRLGRHSLVLALWMSFAILFHLVLSSGGSGSSHSSFCCHSSCISS